ncbi:response regulator transcription factor [Pelagerythrobacter sp.]|uniref:response regulator transcription factor n=1 Tax=Pelagerythrobacter sp. TaxID=2800702 RepID=UPI0035B1F467
MQVNGIAGDSPVHVIDCDSRRRAEISRELFARDVHAEIYEDAAEFLRILPSTGSVLMVEDAERCDLAALLVQLRARGRYYPVSMYSAAPQAERVVRAMREGAIDYLGWPFNDALLAEALTRLREEGDRRGKVEQAKAEAKASVGQLTGREHDVLVSLLHGNSNKQIAAELDLSPRTVEIYRKNVMRKLDAKSTSDAVRIGIYADLWQLPVG